MMSSLRSPKGFKGGSSRIEEILRHRLATRYWKPNDRLPTGKELAKELNACTATIHRHLSELQKEGLIWGQQGKGRFVAGIGQRPRTGNIGVVLFDSRHLANPIMSRLMAGVGEAAGEAAQSLRIFVGNGLRPQSKTQSFSSPGTPNDVEFLGSPAYLGVDGLLVLTQRLSRQTIEHLASVVPVVCCFPVQIPDVSYVMMDMAAGGLEATRHLIALGHQRIALVTKDSSDPLGRALREATRLAMGSIATASGDTDLRTYTAENFDQSEGYRLGKQLLAESRRPTAVICGDHELANGMLQAIEEFQLRVPADISLIAANEALVERKPVSITSIALNPFDAGVRLCKRLLESIEEPGRHWDDEYVRPHLVIRESTAAPPIQP